MPAPKLVEVKKTSSATNLEEEIRIRAYQLYEERGYLPGHEDEDWLVAEQEILSRHDTASRALRFQLRTTWGQPPSAVQSSEARQLILATR